jgi:hypothetical protein
MHGVPSLPPPRGHTLSASCGFVKPLQLAGSPPRRLLPHDAGRPSDGGGWPDGRTLRRAQLASFLTIDSQTGLAPLANRQWLLSVLLC